MSIIEVSLEGYDKAQLRLDLVDDYTDPEGVEVWKAVFSSIDGDGEVFWTVYFEMDSRDGYESWDLISEAIETYKLEVEQYD